MKDKVSEILHAGNIEERLQKVLALSDLLISASITDDLPKNESLNYVALELYSNAEALQEIYKDLIEVMKGEKRATA